jgi:hypothetical protein
VELARLRGISRRIVHLEGLVSDAKTPFPEPKSRHGPGLARFVHRRGKLLHCLEVGYPKFEDGRFSSRRVSDEKAFFLIVGVFPQRADKGHGVLGRIGVIADDLGQGFRVEVFTYTHGFTSSG